MDIMTALREWNNTVSGLMMVVYSAPEVMEWIVYQVPVSLYHAGMTEDEAARLCPYGGFYLHNWHLPEFEEK